MEIHQIELRVLIISWIWQGKWTIVPPLFRLKKTSLEVNRYWKTGRRIRVSSIFFFTRAHGWHNFVFEQFLAPVSWLNTMHIYLFLLVILYCHKWKLGFWLDVSHFLSCDNIGWYFTTVWVAANLIIFITTIHRFIFSPCSTKNMA